MGDRIILAPRIVSDEGVRGGRPVIDGTRLGPDDIVWLWEARLRPSTEQEYSHLVERVCEEYGSLTREQILCAIAWERGRAYERAQGAQEVREQIHEAIDVLRAEIDAALGGGDG